MGSPKFRNVRIVSEEPTNRKFPADLLRSMGPGAEGALFVGPIMTFIREGRLRSPLSGSYGSQLLRIPPVLKKY